ncbi:hypothetical protein [Lysinibacillus parviboronicapiens]|uniref:hypothetical protein n=1 Tax=Lysinibacillus parviboronicapiens TaxID=436516 RepID=UPI000D3DB67E|nr:hypothetical protein [Lysinibacillus parviboronicapiens]
MNKDNIEIGKIKTLFSKDKIYNALKKYSDQEEVLFPEFLKTLSVKQLYTFVEVSKILKINDSSLLYYITKLCKFKYLDDQRMGRNYNFDYISIYKLYLVQQFLKRQGKNMNNVKLLLYESTDDSQKEINLTKNSIKKLEQYISYLITCEIGNIQTKEEVQALYKKIKIFEIRIVSWIENQEEIFKIENSLYTLQKKVVEINDELNKCARKLLYLESDFNIMLLKNDYNLQIKEFKEVIKKAKKSIFNRFLSNRESDIGERICTANLSKLLLDLRNEIFIEQEHKSNLEKELFFVYKEIERETIKKMEYIERNREFINSFLS